ncbi:hypothetical protein GCM10010104_48330 [Streptomyces indiaensis]|uniref:Uncharacterized protein n=1 Tax=Streptomyces indiaensis TaxID=284033 RepID=A0ABP5QWS1_9ACTN
MVWVNTCGGLTHWGRLVPALYLAELGGAAAPSAGPRPGPVPPLIESLPEPVHLVLEAAHHAVQRLHGDAGDAVDVDGVDGLVVGPRTAAAPAAGAVPRPPVSVARQEASRLSLFTT